MAELNPTFKKLSEAAGQRTLVMGVLNITPDSFSDGGLYLEADKALAHAETMLAEGADLLDLGGESTRPGAQPVSLDEELKRVLPVAELLAKRLPEAAWSIDTVKAKVAEEALARGACMINDVSALASDECMPQVAAKARCGVVLMHRAASPDKAAWSTQEAARYGEAGVVEAVRGWLAKRATSLLLDGLDKRQIWIDPGFGFGKSVEDNLSLLKGLPELAKAGYPVLLGTSRKSSLGAVLGGLPERERLEGTAATVALAAWLGAACVRVHDVKEMARVCKVVEAVKNALPRPKSAPETRPLHPFRGEEF
jgi:dihydropteroate synthase